MGLGPAGSVATAVAASSKVKQRAMGNLTLSMLWPPVTIIVTTTQASDNVPDGSILNGGA